MVRESMTNMGIEPMVLDSICPPSSEILYETMDARPLVSRVLIKRKLNSIRAVNLVRKKVSNMSSTMALESNRSKTSVKF
jgi:hypothetical protein